MNRYLQSSTFINADHPDIISFAQKHTSPTQTPIEKAISLFYRIRDGWRYNPYHVEVIPEGYKASNLLARTPQQGGHCIDKANLLAACARALGIPSRLHFANVRNHIGTEKLEEMLGTDVLAFHGYTEMYLEDKWVAATPAFNRELCDYLKVMPMEFDGKTDAVFQEYDRAGGQFMEYLHDYGHFADLPFDLMIQAWQRHYPNYQLMMEQLKEKSS